jgi:hypothetical protein
MSQRQRPKKPAKVPSPYAPVDDSNSYDPNTISSASGNLLSSAAVRKLPPAVKPKNFVPKPKQNPYNESQSTPTYEYPEEPSYVDASYSEQEPQASGAQYSAAPYAYGYVHEPTASGKPNSSLQAGSMEIQTGMGNMNGLDGSTTTALITGDEFGTQNSKEGSGVPTWVIKINDWENQKGCPKACWGCVTCCGRVHYENPKHRRNAAICLAFMLVFIIYWIIALVGQLLVLNSTGSLDHVELFADQTCGGNMPLAMMMTVNNPGYFGNGIGQIDFQIMSFQNASGTFAPPQGNLFQMKGTPAVTNGGLGNVISQGMNKLLFATSLQYGSPNLMGQFSSQLANIIANPGAAGQVLKANMQVTATVTSYVMFGIPLPLTTSVTQTLDLVNMGNDPLMQELKHRITPLNVNITLVSVTGVGNLFGNVVITVQVNGIVPTLKVFLPSLSFDIIDPQTLQTITTLVTRPSFINNAPGLIVADLVIPQTLSNQQLIALTNLLTMNFVTQAVTIRGSQVQPAGSTCVLSNIVQGINPITVTLTAAAT